MEPARHEYKGHVIEFRPRKDREVLAREGAAEGGEELELVIDDQSISYDRLPDGTYFLHEYAYEWSEDLTEVAHSFIDYQSRAKRPPQG